MKRFILPLSLALSMTCGAAFAQQTPETVPVPQQQTMPEGHQRHAPNPQKQAEHLSRKLNLTPDQTSRIEPILATRDEQMRTVWGDQQLSPQDRHQQMRSINQQTEQGMAGVLTPDQLTLLKEMRHHHGRHNPNAEPAENGQSPS